MNISIDHNLNTTTISPNISPRKRNRNNERGNNGDLQLDYEEELYDPNDDLVEMNRQKQLLRGQNYSQNFGLEEIAVFQVDNLGKLNMTCIPCGKVVSASNSSQIKQHLEGLKHIQTMEKWDLEKCLAFERNLKAHQRTKMRAFLVSVYTGMSFHSIAKNRKILKLLVKEHGHITKDPRDISECAPILYQE